jgi:Spy/CpxP family protein refolding chaperone
MTNKESASGSSPGRKWAIVAVAALCVSLLAYRAWSYLPQSVPANSPQPGRMGGPPSRDQIEAMEKNLGITADQRRQLQELRSSVGSPSPQNMAKMREGMERILTVEQRKKMAESMHSMMQQRINRDKAKLSPDQAEKLQQKFEERTAQMRRDGFVMPMPPGGGRP